MRGPSVYRASRAIAAFAALGLAFEAGATAAPKAQPAFTLVPVAGRAWAVIVNGGVNAGFAAGAAGVLLVDPPGDSDTARRLLARIRAVAGRSPRWLVHTRGEAPPSAGDSVFIRGGATVVGPGRTVELGDSRAEISSAPVHAGGDRLVSLAPGDVVFAGELFEKEAVPDLAGADVESWIRVLDGLLADHPAAFFLGARGQPGRALDVRYLRDYVSGLRSAVAAGLSRGETGAALADRALAAQRARFGRWAGFETRARRNLEQVERTLSGPGTTPR